MRALAVVLLFAIGACHHTCPKPVDRPAQVVTVYVGCIGDPRLPARPVLPSLEGAFTPCGDVICSPASTVNALAEYLEQVTYYYAQLDVLCREVSDEEAPDAAPDDLVRRVDVPDAGVR